MSDVDEAKTKVQTPEKPEDVKAKTKVPLPETPGEVDSLKKEQLAEITLNAIKARDKNRARANKHREKMKEKGFIRLAFYVPSERKDEISKRVKAMIAETHPGHDDKEYS